MATMFHSKLSGLIGPVISANFIIPHQSSLLYAIYDIPIQVQTIKSSDNTPIVSSCISSTGRILAFVSQGKKLDVHTFEKELGWVQAYSLQLPFKSVHSMCITHSEKDILLADLSGSVYLLPVTQTDLDLQNLPSILGHCSILTGVATDIHDKYVVTSDSEGKIRVSNFPNAYNIHTYLLSHTEFISQICFVPDSPTKLLSGSGDGTVKLWDVEKSHLYCSLSFNESSISVLDISSLDRILVAVEGKPELYFLEITSDNTLVVTQTIQLESTPHAGCFGSENICWIATSLSFHAYVTPHASCKYEEVGESQNAYFSYLSKNVEWCQIQEDEVKQTILKKRPPPKASKYFENKKEWIEAKKLKVKNSDK